LKPLPVWPHILVLDALGISLDEDDEDDDEDNNKKSKNDNYCPA
jgi:hypothetical protein